MSISFCFGQHKGGQYGFNRLDANTVQGDAQRSGKLHMLYVIYIIVLYQELSELTW